MNVVVVANGPLAWSEELVGLVRGADLVLAADGGANHLARIGVRAEAVVGDLDSIKASVRAWLGEARIVHQPDQETTDLHKTLSFAFDERGARSVTVIAATGGRLDHALENLGLLARFSARGGVEFRGEDGRILAVRGSAEFETAPGQTVSLLPLGRCERVATRGLRWPLRGEPLDLAGRTGVSNVAVGERIGVEVEGGVLLLFLHRRSAGC